MSKAGHFRLFLAASFLWSLNLSAQPDISPHKVQFVQESGFRAQGQMSDLAIHRQLT